MCLPLEYVVALKRAREGWRQVEGVETQSTSQQVDEETDKHSHTYATMMMHQAVPQPQTCHKISEMSIQRDQEYWSHAAICCVIAYILRHKPDNPQRCMPISHQLPAEQTATQRSFQTNSRMQLRHNVRIWNARVPFNTITDTTILPSVSRKW